MYIPECGLYANGSPHNADDGDANESEFVLVISPWYIRTCFDWKFIQLIHWTHTNTKSIGDNLLRSVLLRLPLLGRYSVEFLFDSLSMCLRCLWIINENSQFAVMFNAISTLQIWWYSPLTYDELLWICECWCNYIWLELSILDKKKKEAIVFFFQFYLLMMIVWVMVIAWNDAIWWIITLGRICTRRITIASIATQIQRFRTWSSGSIKMIVYIA